MASPSGLSWVVMRNELCAAMRSFIFFSIFLIRFVNLLQNALDMTSIHYRFVIFEKYLRHIAHPEHFSNLAPQETFGAVQAGFRIFALFFRTYNRKINGSMTKIIRHLDPGYSNKADAGVFNPLYQQL